jgi:uncharacterized protein YecE (DUF72 family)
MSLIVGTAGWSIARTEAESFPAEGSALERYSALFAGVEINSSFHRPHRISTWERWAEQVPDRFRFSVKVPKTITHKQKLVDCGDLLAAFLEESSGLGDKLAVLLVQLPPSLAFDPELAGSFFTLLSASSPAAIACEPRHASWFEEEPSQLLESLRVARVAADPAKVPEAAVPGGWRGFSYFRLHGSPVPYRSSYDEERLDGYAGLIREDLTAGRPAWCVFDNTASSAATGNALVLMDKLA